MDPFEELSQAIIVQAVQDYKESIRFLKRHPHTPDLDTEESKKDKRKVALLNKIIDYEGLRDDVERFFHSDWFVFLSKLDGETLLNKIRGMEVD